MATMGVALDRDETIRYEHWSEEHDNTYGWRSARLRLGQPRRSVPVAGELTGRSISTPSSSPYSSSDRYPTRTSGSPPWESDSERTRICG